MQTDTQQQQQMELTKHYKDTYVYEASSKISLCTIKNMYLIVGIDQKNNHGCNL